jgi:hypothetical protein
MHSCPKCNSGSIHRSHAKTTWEGWRQTLTGKRLYRCRKCSWRGWGADRATRQSSRGMVVAEPPNLETIGLTRIDRQQELDLEALDAFEFRPDGKT